jgi:intracellular sulfur oxidation DsrE/DsrF family protein
MLLLAVGFVAGHWSNPPAPASASAEGRHVILHVNSDDPGKFLLALADAETHAAESLEARVEVVANAGGLDLIRSDRSPVADRVRELMVKYPNIQFVACNITMDKQRWLGEEPVLINGIQVAPSAAEHILRRMEQGWSYTRV